MWTLTDIVILTCVLVYSVIAELQTPPNGLEVYDVSNAETLKLNQGDEVYFKQDVATPQHIRLKCLAKGNPQVTYRWNRNSRAIDVNDPDYDVDSDEGTLYMEHPREGYYQCFADNTYGTGLSFMIPVIRNSLPGFGNENQDIDVQGPVGKAIKLECRGHPISKPAAEFIWRLSTPGSNSYLPIPADNTDRIAINEQGTLFFSYLLNVDSSLANFYYCGMVNGPTTQHGSPTRLNVIPGSQSNFGPELQYKTTNAVGIVGKEVTIECIFAGNPIPKLVWKDMNWKVINSDADKYFISPDTRKLTIRRLEEQDEGNYQCVSGNVQDHIFLDVTSGPIFNEEPMDQIVPIDGDAVFNCDAHPAAGETPLNPPIWYQNGKLIPFADIGVSKKYNLQNEGKQLIVQNVVKRDMKCVQCNVSNTIGYQFRDASLTVVSAIHVTARPAANAILHYQNSTSFTVEATIDSTVAVLQISYQWVFIDSNGQEHQILHDPPHFVLDGHQRNTLIINTEHMNETAFLALNGELQCHIRNSVQEEVVKVALIANLPTPPKPYIQAAAMDLWWIALVIALIVLIIILILICCMCRQYPKGDYCVDEKERKAGHDPEKELADSGFHDLSRMDGDYDGKPGLDTVSLTGSEKPLGSDDDSLTDYGDLDTGKFNEDGSFLGVYIDKNKNNNQSAV